MRLLTKIIGTGSFIPDVIIKNNYFLGHIFYTPNGEKINIPNNEIIQKFEEITGIKERRYLHIDYVNSDMAFDAAANAILSVRNKSFNAEDIDMIIVAHNYGDVNYQNTYASFVPSIAAKVKNMLKIKNPNCIAKDVIFGCPGWLQGVIEADQAIKLGSAKTVMVIGSETLSRVCDPHDRDSMIFSDGAGAVILQEMESEELSGVLSYDNRSDTNLANTIFNSKSYKEGYKSDELFIHMNGHEVFKYAISMVPQVVKNSIDAAGLELDDIDKILIHQANEKLDHKIGQNLFRLYGRRDFDPNIMPMTIDWLGNSSVATIPTLLDRIMKGEMPGHELNPGNNIVLASVGAGMNINSMVYRM